MSKPTLTDYRSALGYLNGEESPLNSTSRDAIINYIVSDAWGRFLWPFRRTPTTLTFTNKVATLPIDFSADGFYDLRLDSTTIYTLIEEKFKDNYVNGDRVCWITNGTINIHEPEPTLTLTYWKEPTTLVAGIDPCDLPVNLVSKGAYAYFKRAEDDEFDIRELLNEYEQEITKLKAQYGRGRTKDNRLVSASERFGHHLGQI